MRLAITARLRNYSLLFDGPSVDRIPMNPSLATTHAYPSRLPSIFSGLGFGLSCALLFATLQPFEMGPMEGGKVVALRAAAATCFALMTLLSERAIPGPALAMSGLFSFVFLLINLQNPGLFVLPATVLIFATSLAIGTYVRQNPRQLGLLLSAYLWINVIGFLAAWVLAHGFGVVIDLHHLIYPMSNARILSAGGVLRITGFHIEPGTYAQWTFVALTARALLYRIKVEPLTILCLLTLILAFSAWSILAVAAYAALMVMTSLVPGSRNRRGDGRQSTMILIVSLLGAAALLAVYLQPYMAYVQGRYALSDISGLSKVIALRRLLASIEQVAFWGRPLTETYCPACLSPQDLGAWSSFAYYVGVLPSAVLLTVLVVRLVRDWGPIYLPLLAIILLTKMWIFEPALWLFVSIIILRPVTPGLASRRTQPADGARLTPPANAAISTLQERA